MIIHVHLVYVLIITGLSLYIVDENTSQESDHIPNCYDYINMYFVNLNTVFCMEPIYYR